MRLPAGGGALLGLILLSVLSLQVHAQSDAQIPLGTPDSEPESACHNACTALAQELGPQTLYNSPDIKKVLKEKFWSTHQEITIPACIFTPSEPQHISLALPILKQYECHFAVRSGGHGLFSGASNAKGGVTIDMGAFHDVDFLGRLGEEEGEVTRVGTGAKWGHVYKAMEPLGKVVVGGRDSDVGVGGFLLGGGISFLSRRYGWAVDNVRNFEVVLANGSIANINQASAPDLFWALRGGGNNFGIVTRFDLETYDQAVVFGGHSFTPFVMEDVTTRKSRLGLRYKHTSLRGRLFDMSRDLLYRGACALGYCIPMEGSMQAFMKFIADETDNDAQVMYSMAYERNSGLFVGGNHMAYAKPIANPAPFDHFKGWKSLYDLINVKNLTTLADQVNSLSPPGLRHTYAAATFKPSAALISEIADIFMRAVEPFMEIKSGIAALVFQPIHTHQLEVSQRNGGNCLGLTPEDGPLINMLINLDWVDAEDNERVNAVGKKILDGTVAKAKEMGLWHRFTYQNYANITQDVFAGYGEENREKLKVIQKKWDPEGVFRLQRGYFKV